MRNFLCIVFFLFANTTLSQELVNGEFFIDSDPGVGNGMIITIPGSPAASTVLSDDVDILSISPGIHRICVRFLNQDGLWNASECRTFYVIEDVVPDPSNTQITESEYFFNSDPGPGNGEAITIVGAPVDVTTLSTNLDILGFPPGTHKLCLRFKNNQELWNAAFCATFLVLEPPVSTLTSIVAAEYFLSTINDPGPGNGTSLDVAGPLDNVTISELIDISALSDGDYSIFIRFKSEDGLWSAKQTQNFTVCASATPYFLDADSDGYGDLNNSIVSCDPFSGYVTNSDDCDDTNELVNITAVLWYADSDGDGYGDPGNSQMCKGPAGFVLNNQDCDDTNELLNPDTEWYEDSDEDGFGNFNVTMMLCAQPSGFVANADDCDDTDPVTNPDRLWYFDSDQDGYGDPLVSQASCDQPSGYVDNPDDCDDTLEEINPNIVWYEDLDGDGFGNFSSTTQSCTQPAGFVANSDDCNDNDAQINPDLVWYRDLDEDGFGNADITQVSCSQPSGFVLNAEDCNDSDNQINPETEWFEDSDGDGFGNLLTTASGCLQPSGFVANATDCDDTSTAILDGPIWYLDSDGDGYGDINNPQQACSQPSGYVLNSEDCNDNEPGINPETIWYADLDEDGSGDINNSLVTCIQPTSYTLNATDCNDSDPDVYPDAPALPDGKDNDCDGNNDRVEQVITLDPIPDLMDNAPEYGLVASSDSGLPVVFSVVSGGISVSGNLLTPTDAGSAILQASQSGDNRYLEAESVTDTLCVNPTPEVTREANTLSTSYDDATYQWFIDGTLLPGATGISTPISATGDYTVLVVVDGCEGTSIPQFFRPTEPLIISSIVAPDTQVDDIPASLEFTITGGLPPYTIQYQHKKFLADNYTNGNTTISETGQKFSFDILPSMVDEIGFSFKAVVSDALNQPEDIEEQVVYKEITAASSPSINYSGFSSNDPKSYRIVSIPYQITNSRVDEMFTDLGRDVKDWRLVKFEDGTYQDKRAGDRIIPGQSYWFIARSAFSKQIGAGRVPQSPFSLALQPGWNMIATPFPVDINWPSVLATNDIDDGTISGLYTFNASSASWNVNSTLLMPFEGGFVFSEVATTLLIRPDQNGSSASTEMVNYTISELSIDASEWKLDLNVGNKILSMGMHSDAKAKKDPYDQMIIPDLETGSEVFLEREDYFYPFFKRDVIQTSSDGIWNLKLTTDDPKTELKISWDNLPISRSLSDLWLVDATRGEIANMAEVSTYTLSGHTSYDIIIQYNSDGNFIPAQLVLGNAYPNPARAQVFVPVALPDHLDKYDLKLDVIDLNGRTMATIIDGIFAPGMYVWDWDGNTNDGTRLLPGVYIYRLTYNGEQSRQKRIILK